MIEETSSHQGLPLIVGMSTSLLCMLFGANAVAIKISLFGMGPFTAAGVRFSMAIFAICLWARITRRPFGIQKGQIHQLLVISIIFTFQLSCLYIGFSRTSASRGTLLINLQPFFVLFLAHFFIPGEQMTPRKSMGLIMGFAGMAFVFLGKQGVATEIQIGDFMILITAFLWACSTVYIKRIINGFGDPFQLVMYPMIFSVPFFFLGGLLWDHQMIVHMDVKVVVSLLYQGLATASFGYVAWNNLLRKYGAVSLHSFIFIMPIAGVFFGGLILGDPMTYHILMALLLIVSGACVVNLKAKRNIPIVPTRGI